MDWSQVINALQDAAVTIALAGISVLVTMAVTYLNKLKTNIVLQTDKIQDENTRKLVNNAVSRVSDLVTTTVKSFQQEIVGEIKEGISDGKYTREDLLNLREKAADVVMNQLTDDIKEILQLEITDVREYILNLVSEKVYDLKEGVVPSATLISSED